MFPPQFMMVSQLKYKGNYLSYPLEKCFYYDLKTRVIFHNGMMGAFSPPQATQKSGNPVIQAITDEDHVTYVF